MLDEIKSWVEIETPTEDAVAVNRLVDKIETEATAAGATTKRIAGKEVAPGRKYGDLLLVASPWGGEEPGVLVVSHIDTVHPKGTLGGGLPFRVEGNTAYGPGIYDMKGGAVIAFAALCHLIRSGGRTKLPVRHLFVSDEEVGSPTSRALIEEEARRARYVFVTEPARDGGKIVTSRKGGTASFNLQVTGRSAHSLGPQDGRSAVLELARQILDLDSMNDYDRGLLLNIGVIGGGTSTSIVPEHAFAKISMSSPDAELTEEVIARVLALKSYDPDVLIEVTAKRGRHPGYEKTPEIDTLFQHARKLAAEIGFDLVGVNGPIGGDANFTAQFAPTLDGMGPDGQGAHSHQEQIVISSLIPRATLLLRLFETLG
ncbi:MAG: M20 family peptidase [Mesorhizobium sp.]|uniref:M20 family metallopeptidase n=1 Tax=Mesorhizobium sp. TaxID=1871066 RepID=UPI000FE5AF53|nr:M20 family metallopeptidase [Mesorhizobium sp.]RWM05902.1 MAG: M20 family peptidase [Mesorhizobium sp.]